MIVLDASVLIAAFDPADAHHDRAAAILRDNADRSMRVSPITRAECLVAPARAGRLDEFAARLRRMGVDDVALPDDAAVRLARLRASTPVKLPDCCVLLAAQQTQAEVATFDGGLASAAANLGLPVLAAD